MTTRRVDRRHVAVWIPGAAGRRRWLVIDTAGGAADDYSADVECVSRREALELAQRMNKGGSLMFEDDYPILAAAHCLRDAAGWLDRADDIIGRASGDVHTGEPIPTPPELGEAQSLWQQAWELIGQAAKKLKPLADAERQRADEDDRDSA